jgi:hypothetical protein
VTTCDLRGRRSHHHPASLASGNFPQPRVPRIPSFVIAFFHIELRQRLTTATTTTIIPSTTTPPGINQDTFLELKPWIDVLKLFLLFLGALRAACSCCNNLAIRVANREWRRVRHRFPRRTAICRTPLQATWRARPSPNIWHHNQIQAAMAKVLALRTNSPALDILVLRIMQVHRMQLHQPHRRRHTVATHLKSNQSNVNHEPKRNLCQLMQTNQRRRRSENLALTKA